MSLIELKHINHSFGNHRILEDFSMNVEDQELLAITGPSGSGKSTLLNILGLLMKPDQGEMIHFGYKNVKPNTHRALQVLRNEIGYLFQNYALIDSATVRENMAIALKYSKVKDKKGAMQEALKEVGLIDKEDAKVSTLSGGEQQRLAMARLIVKPCRVILADEPTGNLDEDNSLRIVNLFKRMQDSGKSIVIVTHQQSILKYFDRIIEIGK